jgi:hypothetical protein
MGHGFVQAKVTGVKPLLCASYSAGKAQNQSLSCSPWAAEQFVGRERRERLSQLAWYGAGCFDSRRRVNSDVGCFVFQLMRNTPKMLVLVLVVALLFSAKTAYCEGTVSSTIGDAHAREFVFRHSRLALGQRGFYTFPRNTRLRGDLVPKGTRIVAEVTRNSNGKMILVTADPLIVGSRLIAKGTTIPFR